MTAKELQQYVNAPISWHVQGMRVDAVILDARMVYGKLQFQITPRTGTGTVWIDALTSASGPTGETW